MESRQYTYHYTVKLRDTDAAGLLFFGNLFNIIHDAYEAFMDSAEVSIGYFIREKKFMLPVVRAESEYLKPQFVGDRIDIILQCEKIGKSSYTIAYKVVNQDGETACKARTVNVVLDKKTRKIVPIPHNLREALKTIL